VWLYRSTDGMMSRWSKVIHVLMLTTPGRRSGLPRSTCVRYLAAGADLLVWGSGSGSPRDPDWFENLRHSDVVQVQTGPNRFPARRRELTGAERDHVWETIILTQAPQVAKYATKAQRTIPVALLSSLPSSRPDP
jgi:deazaflavin-dependent oxidoreductase (nitroreductase family)